MVQIDLLDALRPVRLNVPDRDGRFFVLVEASDGCIYQVKFNTPNTTSNQNEFIGYMIAKECGVPAIDGALLKIDKTVFDSIINRVSKYKVVPPVDIYRQNIMFGVLWKDVSVTPQTNEQLSVMIDGCRNKQSFYSIFPYDQYLRNYDRQPFNHLILLEGANRKPTFYAAIDTDRIFGNLNWDRAAYEKELYDCFHESFHDFLYSLIDDSSFTNIFRSAGKIDCIPDDYLHNIVDTVDRLYVCDNDKLAIIREFLVDRKVQIIDKCAKALCFKNVRQKGL
ncbi:hypothetical protein [Sulfurovum sp.]|uniref:hypothetical protein n=1 Tax=Sulfurovum sp. TaxID=1969726 RepID=UPI0025D50C0B|nr:hypothetical protein [Sulfurovum sp.]